MPESQQLSESMWDLVYGLLSEEESQQLIERIKSEPDVARLYAEVRLRSDLVAQAAKVEDSGLVLDAALHAAPPPVERPALATPALGTSQKARQVFTWLAAVGATALAVLLAVGLGVRQAARSNLLADAGVVVDILGHSAMPAGLSRAVTVRTYALGNSGQKTVASAADLELRLVSANGKELLRRSVATGEAGEATVEIPGEALAPGVQLEVASAQRADKSSSRRDASARQEVPPQQALVRAPLPVEPEPQVAYFLCAEPTIEPGKAVDVSLWSFNAFSNKLAGPEAASAAVESLDGVRVEETEASPSQQGLLNAKLEVTADTFADAAGRVRGGATIQQQPAGQRVALQQNEPLRRETLAESSRADPAVVTRARTLTDARRQSPRRVVRQQVQLADSQAKPAAEKAQAAGAAGLAAPAAEGNNADGPEMPTLAAGRPFVMPLSPELAGKSLLATAVCRGVTVATVVKEPSAPQATSQAGEEKRGQASSELQLNLPPEADGVVDVFVYDRTSSEPVLIEQRSVYREPLRKLNIALTGEKPRFTPGERVQLQVQVTDEQGKPAADALVGVRVWNELALNQSDEQPVLLEDAVRGGVIESEQEEPGQMLQSVADTARRAGRANAYQQYGQQSRVGQAQESAPAPAPTTPPSSSAVEADRTALAARAALAKDQPADQASALGTQPNADAGAAEVPPAIAAAAPVDMAQQVVLASNREAVRASAAAEAQSAQLSRERWLATLGTIALVGGGALLLVLGVSAVQRSLPRLIVLWPTAIAAAASIVVGLGWIGWRPAAQWEDIARTSRPAATATVAQRDTPPAGAASTGGYDAGPSSLATAPLPQTDTEEAKAIEPSSGGFGAAAAGARAGAVAERVAPSASATVPPAEPQVPLPASPPAVIAPVVTRERSAQLAAGRGPPPANETPQQAPAALYFNPQLATDAAGRANIEFVMPPVESEYRVLIDALGQGRVGSYQQQLIVGGSQGAK